MPESALITGITGQDGSYLAEFLLARGYRVHGMVRHSSSDSRQRISHLAHALELHEGDLHDQCSIERLLREVMPREVYNLGAQSFVPTSWHEPLLTAESTGLGVARMLEAVRMVDPTIRFYQASSSLMFGHARSTPQNEDTPFWPRSPYAAAKIYGHWMTVNYRESYQLFACSGIMFNHESPRRGYDFVTRKISRGVARIKLGLANELRLGNLQARRDWGYAGDYVRAMWLMLQQETPADYVIGSGQARRVEDFVAAAFDNVDLDWREYVVVDPAFYRPAEVDVLVADPRRAEQQLGWTPDVSFEELVGMMVAADLEELRGARTRIEFASRAA